MSDSFNNTSSTGAPQTSQPLGAPLSGSTHTGSTNNPFTDSHASSGNPIHSTGHNNSHPSAALTGEHNTGIGGANTGNGNYGAASHSTNPLSSHEGHQSSHNQTGGQKEGLMDALNPKTGGGTHLPKKTDDNSYSNDSEGRHNTNAPGSNSLLNPAANPPVSSGAHGNSSVAHGQQTGNTIFGSAPAGATNQSGFKEKTVGGSGFTESAHSSNTHTHTNLDAGAHDHDRTPNFADRVTGHEAGGLAPRADHDPKDHATPGLGKNLGGDSYHDQPGSAHASSHRNKVDPRDVDTEIGSKNMHSTPQSGGGPVSVGGGMDTGRNSTLPGGVKGTGGMGKRDGEEAMGGGGGIVGKIAEKLGMGHGNTKTDGSTDKTH